jgi:hypothetical protein
MQAAITPAAPDESFCPCTTGYIVFPLVYTYHAQARTIKENWIKNKAKGHLICNINKQCRS